MNAPPTPAQKPGPERAAEFTSICRVTCALAAGRDAIVPPASARATRLSPLARRASPHSAPANVRWAITPAAPRLSSVAVSCCDCNARTDARTSRLGNGDVVTDRDVGRERRDDRAVLLEREVDRAPDLYVVGPLPPDGEMKRNRGVAAGLGLAARAAHGDVEALELDALLLQNDHDVGRRAGRRGDEQQLDRGCGGLRIAVDENRGTARAVSLELQLPQPAHRHVGRRRHASCPVAS